MSAKITPQQKHILGVYSKLAQKFGVYPSRADMKAAGVSRDQIRHHFGSILELKVFAKKQNPDAFNGIIDEVIFSKSRLKELKDDVRKFKRFVVTTVVGGCDLHKGFYKSIKKYCEVNDAALLLLMCADPAKSSGSKFSMHPQLMSEHIVTSDVALNSNIFISTIKLSAKHIDPITSLTRIGQRSGSFIYASPKQRLKMTPTSNTKMPHAVMTTGAITMPNYQTDRYMSERTAYIAHNDHVMGAIVVEIENDSIYHFRQIQAEWSTGNFIDLGKMYSKDSVTEVKAAAFIMGDYHSGSTDPGARKAWQEVLASVPTKRVFFHDLFDGMSINHHDQHKKLLKARRFADNKTSLDKELRGVTKDINEYTPLVDEVVIVKSNHDVFLERYLDEAMYVEDPQNHLLALELAAAMGRGEDPLKYGVEKYGLKDKEKVRWLSIDEDFRIARIECGAHGHKGANGAKGSIRAMENAYGNSVSGHEHTPQILRGAWVVGTSSLLKLSYNEGPSSWMHTSCIVYDNGSRQLINSIRGKWRL